jgi:hypothetical protein
MGVYEARQQGSITQIDDGGAGRDSAASDRLNFPSETITRPSSSRVPLIPSNSLADLIAKVLVWAFRTNEKLNRTTAIPAAFDAFISLQA